MIQNIHYHWLLSDSELPEIKRFELSLIDQLYFHIHEMNLFEQIFSVLIITVYLLYLLVIEKELTFEVVVFS
jgi:hypothetical protein